MHPNIILVQYYTINLNKMPLLKVKFSSFKLSKIIIDICEQGIKIICINHSLKFSIMLLHISEKEIKMPNLRKQCNISLKG